MADSSQFGTATLPPWSFNRLGPFYRLQRRLGLLSDDDLAAGRRALLFAALAFFPSLVLAVIQGLAIHSQPQRALLHDFSAYAMVIAIAAFILMEKTSDDRMQGLVRGFSLRGLVPDEGLACFERARERMERRTGLAWVEALLAVGAYLLAYGWLFRLVRGIEGGTWAGQVVDDTLHLSYAGLWAIVVTMPLFLFLLGRWLWRFVAWGLLLRDLARCDLRLVATHADRCGGLAFIGQYPRTYMLFAFSVSLMLSAGVLKQVVHAGVDLLFFKFAALGLAVFLLLLFALPLLAFSGVLRKLKRHGLNTYGALIGRHNQAFEARWGSATQSPQEMLGSPDMSSLADLSMSYDLVKRMLPVPIVKEGLLPLLVAVLSPMAFVAATQAPLKQVLAALKAMLLI